MQKRKRIAWSVLAVAAVLFIAAALDPNGSYFQSTYISNTNFVAEEVVTNGITLGGVRNTSWPAGTTNYNFNGNSISNIANPSNPQDAATKSYVDSVAAGLSPKPSVVNATTIPLPANVYVNGALGIGATLTATNNGALIVDGVTNAVLDRILVKNEAAPANNGIYVVTATGSGILPYILTRATDNNQASEFDGAFVFVESGTVNVSSGWVCTATGTVVMGTTAINWTQFSGAGEITVGTGLTQTGNTISVTGNLTNWFNTPISAVQPAASALTNLSVSNALPLGISITTPTNTAKGLVIASKDASVYTWEYPIVFVPSLWTNGPTSEYKGGMYMNWQDPDGTDAWLMGVSSADSFIIFNSNTGEHAIHVSNAQHPDGGITKINGLSNAIYGVSFNWEPHSSTNGVFWWSGGDTPIQFAHMWSSPPMLQMYGTNVNMFESGRLRFSEVSSNYQGSYIHYDGVLNTFRIGTHEPADSIASNDVDVISINRTTANMGIGVTAPTSSLQMGGSFSKSIASGGNFTLTATNHIFFANLDARTIKLPSASGCLGREYQVWIVSPANTATLTNSNGSDLLNGALSVAMTGSNKCWTAVSDGSKWWVTASVVP